MSPADSRSEKRSTPVEALTHEDKRVNIPTADARDFVDPSLSAPVQLRYERDPSLDPQLVWKGKDAQDGEDLLVDAPPIYIQEKIDPRVLVENLRRTAERPEDEPELTLFDSFDGLEDWDAVDYYKHDANWSNRLILGDSLQVMGSLAERERLRGKVQMIYLDPPYGIKFGSNWQVSTRKRDVKDGKAEDATREVEQIKAFRDTWELGIHSYLSYLRDRLVVARDLLTESGSIFVQIGDENVHLVRAVLDEVFGNDNFCAQIVFAKTASFSTDLLSRTHDCLLWYARDRERVKYRRLLKPLRERTEGGTYTWAEIPGQRSRRMTRDEITGFRDLPPGTRRFRAADITSAGASEQGSAPVEIDGKTYRPSPGTHWKTTREGVQRLAIAGRVSATTNRLGYRRYSDDFPWMAHTDVWEDTTIGTFSDKWFVVQTGNRAVERCLLMTTDPGDLVLDPTCGSGTTAYVAEQWGRRWITIDTSRVAIALARQRIMGAKLPYYLLADSPDGRKQERDLTGVEQPTTPTNNDVRKGFVYERVPHVTLKSIANNPDIREGMSRVEIDVAIAKHADTETLFDRPYEAKRKVRVSGPFTVESLSPHRAAAFETEQPETEQTAQREGEGESFTQTILDNLLKAGVQNGWRNERLDFASLTPYAHPYIQAEGTRKDAEEGTPERIAVSIGPQYGTVDPDWIKTAAREALKGQGFDMLLVCGFAFDARVVETIDEFRPDGAADFTAVQSERRLGRLPILIVRMNADLAMGDVLLKKTGSGNLFTVFGEPDVLVKEVDGQLVVEIRGVDVYNPTTGDVRSSDTDDIAMWMIDTDYNEESFFVRHCYFTGGGTDPYARLKRALKADIDEAAWASLYDTTSRPFPSPSTGKIAVKVINHYGDEVLKVYEL